MKKIIFFVVVLSFIILAVGCSSDEMNTDNETVSSDSQGSSESVDENTTENEPITIKYWHSHSEAQLEGLNYMITEFNKQFPHITVEEVYQGGYGDLHKKLMASVVTKEVPTVTNVENASLANFADSGVFNSIEPFIEEDNFDLDDFSKGMLAAYAYQDVQYGLPLIVSTSVMIYNQDLFDELGVEPPQTWDEIPAFAEAVTVKKGDEVERYAFSVPGWSSWYYDPWIINGGGQIITEDQKSGLDQPETMKFLNNFKEWKNNGWMHIGYGKGASDTMRQMFLDQKIGMVEHTSSFIKWYVDNADFEIGVSFLPGDEQRISHIGGAGIVMMAGAEDKEKQAGWEFMKFMTSAEHNIKWADYTGYLPTRKSAIESEEGQAYFKNKPQYQAVFDYFDNVSPRIQHVAYDEFRNFYQEVVGRVALENAEVEPLMKEAAEKMNDVLEEYQ